MKNLGTNSKYWATVVSTLTVVAIVTVLLVRRLRFIYALKNVPSPLALPLIGNAIQLMGSQEEFFKNLVFWKRKFGDIFLLWVGMRPFVFLYKVEAVQPLLSSSVHIDKSLEYNYLKPWLGTGLIISSGKKWVSRRKLLTPTFHGELLDRYLGTSISEAKILVSCLQKMVGEPSFNIVPFAKLAALDVICETAMGYHVNAQTNRESDYVLAVDKISSIVQQRFTNIWISYDTIFRRTSLGKEHQRALDTIHSFTEKVIAERKAEWNSKHDGNFNEASKKRQALLDLLLEMSKNGAVLSDEDIREEVNTFMFAGHDTVANSISWILYSLGRHPEYQEIILEECDEFIGSKEITLERLNKLEWLDACIKEAWRLYPVVPLIGRQIYKPINILGINIPSDTTVIVNTYILHRDPRYFPDPEVYKPERFLASSPRPPSFSFIPFSAGSRNCIGSRFALMEVKIMILSILKAFNVRSIDKENQLRLVGEIVLVNVGGIRLKITPRK